MTSLQLGITPHRRAAARLIGTVRRKLQKAFADSPDVTQAQIADALGVHRAVINRQFRGTKDISLGRVAELAYLLGYETQFDLVKPSCPSGANAPADDLGHPSFKTVQATATTNVKLKPAEAKLELAQ